MANKIYSQGFLHKTQKSFLRETTAKTQTSNEVKTGARVQTVGLIKTFRAKSRLQIETLLHCERLEQYEIVLEHFSTFSTKVLFTQTHSTENRLIRC